MSERSARARADRYNAELEAAVLARTKDLAETQLEVVLRLAQAAELHDDDTGEHIERMSRMCGDVALELGLPPTRAETIRYAAVLHDVGKIGVPDNILRKPARLTPEEMTTMRKHVVEGALLLEGSPSPVLQVARDHRRHPPRAVGRHRVSERAARRGDPLWRGGSRRSATSSTR